MGLTPPKDQRGLWERTRDQVVTWFGDIKMFSPLPFLPRMLPIYDPGSYKVGADETRALETLLQPGDLLLRGYDCYLDGMVIPGFYSHAGLYLGELTESELNARGLLSTSQAAKANKGKEAKRHERGFACGRHIVAHSMAEGVFTEDLIGFCRTDYMAVLRLPSKLAPRKGLSPFAFTPAESKSAAALLQDRLLSSGEEGLELDSCWPVLKAEALAKLGAHYDFGFNFRNFNDLSCTEYVHWSLRSLQSVHGIAPHRERVFLVARTLISPDDLVKAKGSLEHVWASAATPTAALAKLGWRGPCA